MKRTLAILLTLALLLPLAACGGGTSLVAETEPETVIHTLTEAKTEEVAGKHDATGFCAGFGRACITPTVSVPLGGYGATSLRMSQNALDDLYATCVALRDEDGTALLIFQFDMLLVTDDMNRQIRSMLTTATGLPGDNILLNATHTHSGPDVYATEDAGTGVWRKQVYEAAVEAAKTALSDLDACTVYVGTTRTERLNFIRRYYREDGFATAVYTYGTGDITAHESEIDEEMRIVKFDRVNQKDVVLVNWQCHPTMTGGNTKPDVSSDFVGQFRKYAERDLDVKFLYLQGGAGNIAAGTRLPGEEARGTNYVEEGKLLAAHLSEGLANLKETPVGKIRAAQTGYQGVVNHTDDGKVEVARKIYALFNSGKTAEAQLMANENGISSAYEANSIINRYGRGATKTLDLYCYAFGDVAITAAPFESFCQIEKKLREDSPFGFTLSCGYSNGANSYIPAAECFPNKGYEVMSCQYVPGTAEEVSAEHLKMLNELAAQ